MGYSKHPVIPVTCIFVLVLCCGCVHALKNGRAYQQLDAPYACYINVSLFGHTCSGVIITEMFTATTALCQKYEHIPIHAMASAGGVQYKSARDMKETQNRMVDDWIFFDLSDQTNYDISLQKISYPWEFNAYVQPLPVATHTTLPQNFADTCKVIGFGYTSSGLGRGHMTDMQMETWRGCSESERENVMCVRDPNGAAICMGDQGGPVVCQEDGSSVLYGLVTGSIPFQETKRRKRQEVDEEEDSDDEEDEEDDGRDEEEESGYQRSSRCTEVGDVRDFTYTGYYYQWIVAVTGRTREDIESLLQSLPQPQQPQEPVTEGHRKNIKFPRIFAIPYPVPYPQPQCPPHPPPPPPPPPPARHHGRADKPASSSGRLASTLSALDTLPMLVLVAALR